MKLATDWVKRADEATVRSMMDELAGAWHRLRKAGAAKTADAAAACVQARGSPDRSHRAIPAKAGIHLSAAGRARPWVPASAGATGEGLRAAVSTRPTSTRRRSER